MPLWRCNCPLPALAVLACLSPVGDGPACSRLALVSPLFCERSWRCLRLGLFVFLWGNYPTVWFAIPQSGLLSQVSSLRLPSGHSGPGPYSKQCSPHLPAQPPLTSEGCRRLHCFSLGSYHWALGM